ncbi:MAG: alanine--glyoxylate aminotransferase family protein, partial [Cypionkella sp.]
MNLPHAHIDEGGLQEFSVVFTDRSLNHMSARFGGAMREISALLRGVYGASAMALIPGGGSYAMEAVARQFGQGRSLIVRNGWFSYRWSQIFDACQMGEQEVVMAQRSGNSDTAPYAPPPIET